MNWMPERTVAPSPEKNRNNLLLRKRVNPEVQVGLRINLSVSKIPSLCPTSSRWISVIFLKAFWLTTFWIPSWQLCQEFSKMFHQFGGTWRSKWIDWLFGVPPGCRWKHSSRILLAAFSSERTKFNLLGHGGVVVSVSASYSEDPSSIPAGRLLNTSQYLYCKKRRK